jgi:molecular chaperone GrpE
MSESELEQTPSPTMPEAAPDAHAAAPDARASDSPPLAGEGSGERSGAPAEVRALLERVAGLERELAAERERATEYMQKWQRAQADHANSRRRSQQEQEQLTTMIFAQTSALLLPALDSLERAFRTLPETLRHLSWIDGVALVEMQLRRTLEAQGVTAFEPQPGEPLNPARHQPIAEAETAQQPEGAIAEVVQRGYEWRGQVLRPALVSVARKPSAAASATASATTSGSGPPGQAPAEPEPPPGDTGGTAASDTTG